MLATVEVIRPGNVVRLAGVDWNVISRCSDRTGAIWLSLSALDDAAHVVRLSCKPGSRLFRVGA